jgi:AcrR family transcriptional regulator
MSRISSAVRASQIRRPRQRRSQERVEAILDAAERLLSESEPGDISIYTLAEEAGMPPPSIYHFFPDSQHVFGALAERYFDKVSRNLGPIPDELRTWQDVMEYRFAGTRHFYNGNIAARKVILGSGNSWSIRARDFELVQDMARGGVAEIAHYFILPVIPGMIDRMTETIAMNDGIWAIHNHRYGYLPDEQEEYARRARIAHMRTYLPEYLVRRHP